MTPSPFVIQEYVRWSDVDFAGIICYGAYLRFFELAETELFRAAGVPYGEVFDRFDLWLPRAQIHCDFRYPARLDDRLEVGTYFSRIGTKSVTINFDVLHKPTEQLGAEAHQVLVCVDRTSLKSKPVPAALVDLLNPYAMSLEQARTAMGVTSGVS